MNTPFNELARAVSAMFFCAVAACSAFGQSNDVCEGAIMLTPGVLHSMDVSGATTNGEPAFVCGGSLGHGVWFTVKATNNTRVTINTCTSNFRTTLAVYTNTCGTLGSVVCNSGGSSVCGGADKAGVSFNGVSNTIYFVLVGARASDSGILRIVADTTPPPTNDTCAGAIELQSGVGLTMSTTNATDFEDPVTACGGLGHGVWFTVKPTNYTRVNISSCASTYRTTLQVYTNTCGSFGSVVCDAGGSSVCGGADVAGVSFNGVSNTTYFILAGGRVDESGDLRLAVDMTPPPTNDTCSGAIRLESGVAQFVSTTNATDFGEPSLICNNPTAGRGVWYKVTPAVSEQVNISTCGSSYATMLAVYTNVCDSFGQVTCSAGNSPFCGGDRAGVSFPGIGGVTYYILVESGNNVGGTLQIQSGFVDLTPANLVLTGPSNGLPVAGKSLTGQLRVLNQSSTSINGGWIDRLSLSNVATYSVQVLKDITGGHIAQGGGFYTNDIAVILPAVVAGEYVFIAEVDLDHQITETNESNNILMLSLQVTNQPPSVVLITPTNTLQLTSCVPVFLTLTAMINPGSYAVTNVEFYDGSTWIGRDTNFPAVVQSVPLEHGDHFITARAFDVFDLRGTSQPPSTVSVQWPGELHALRADLFYSNCVICMKALSGSNYVMETTTNLRPAVSWTPLLTNQITGSIWVITNSPTAPQKYFRARMLP